MKPILLILALAMLVWVAYETHEAIKNTREI